MIKIKVKSVWQDKVGIRDKYVQRAYDKKDGLEIVCQHEMMTIPAEQVQEKIVAKSEQPFKDKFSDKWHYLFYFDWKPLNKQKTLL